MIISTVLLLVGILLSILGILFAVLIFFKQKNVIVKIITSGFLFINLIAIAIIFTSISGYSLSGLIDIILIYFILGFASFLLYFIFFNKRS